MLKYKSQSLGQLKVGLIQGQMIVYCFCMFIITLWVDFMQSHHFCIASFAWRINSQQVQIQTFRRFWFRCTSFKLPLPPKGVSGLLISTICIVQKMYKHRAPQRVPKATELQDPSIKQKYGDVLKKELNPFSALLPCETHHQPGEQGQFG